MIGKQNLSWTKANYCNFDVFNTSINLTLIISLDIVPEKSYDI